MNRHSRTRVSESFATTRKVTVNAFGRGLLLGSSEVFRSFRSSLNFGTSDDDAPNVPHVATTRATSNGPKSATSVGFACVPLNDASAASFAFDVSFSRVKYLSAMSRFRGQPGPRLERTARPSANRSSHSFRAKDDRASSKTSRVT